MLCNSPQSLSWNILSIILQMLSGWLSALWCQTQGFTASSVEGILVSKEGVGSNPNPDNVYVTFS